MDAPSRSRQVLRAMLGRTPRMSHEADRVVTVQPYQTAVVVNVVAASADTAPNADGTTRLPW